MEDEDEKGFSRRGMSPGKGASVGDAQAEGRLDREETDRGYGTELSTEAQGLESLATSECQLGIEFE